VILKKWDAGDYSHMLPSAIFPDSLDAFVGAEFDRLRMRRAVILQDLETYGDGEMDASDDTGPAMERLLWRGFNQYCGDLVGDTVARLQPIEVLEQVIEAIA